MTIVTSRTREVAARARTLAREPSTSTADLRLAAIRAAEVAKDAAHLALLALATKPAEAARLASAAREACDAVADAARALERRRRDEAGERAGDFRE